LLSPIAPFSIASSKTPSTNSIAPRESSAPSTTDRISYYAFTATPKAKTLELFGHLPNPELPPSATNKPVAFHLYSMRQAIEEGFILDVLQRYTTYDTAWRIAHPDGDEEEVDSKKARAKLARWVRLHPYNINQKIALPSAPN
jgi:type I restriction enzyme R subunit